MSTPREQEFTIPADLLDGAQAAALIQMFLRKRGADYAGGQRVFYSPQEWRARGEEYGLDAILIVCHDGGEHAGFFNPAYERYRDLEAMRKELEKHGFWAEQQTGWYTAIYKRRGNEK